MSPNAGIQPRSMWSLWYHDSSPLVLGCTLSFLLLPQCYSPLFELERQTMGLLALILTHKENIFLILHYEDILAFPYVCKNNCLDAAAYQTVWSNALLPSVISHTFYGNI